MVFIFSFSVKDYSNKKISKRIIRATDTTCPAAIVGVAHAAFTTGQMNAVFHKKERTLVNFTDRWHAFFDRTIPNIVIRIIIMVFGLAFVAASVGLTRATGLGTSPISCVPTTLSFFTPLTIGGWTFVMNVLFVIIQILLLRRDFKMVYRSVCPRIRTCSYAELSHATVF